MSLPTGTVTFLFTDIEGSTKRWETNAQAMRTVLARHDAVMRQAIAERNGHVFKTIGDAFCAVFQRADDAIEACLKAQRGMKDIDVVEIGPVCVRMALHTGESDERDGDYFGPALNRVARLLAIGHGEQVLVSSTTHDVTQRWLHSGMSLRDLGVHRLKDLAESEHVFQLVHPDLRSSFPALRSVQSLPNNLPRQLSSFVGRQRELDDIKQLITDSSLLTLTGAGGCGKTRLALRLGQSLLEEFSDGVWLVELAALADAKLVPDAAMQALGLREQGGKPIMQTVLEYLTHKKVLLILDNCEHLLEACARFVGEILASGADDKVIATSREALGVSGEVSYRVPSLSLPTNGAVRAEEILRYESVALFVERARSAKPGFMLTDAAAPSVARICQRLDGIPLAIELAAARVKVLSVEQINAKLDDRFRLLTGGSRTALERHQTLRAAIAWSYGMLTDDEKHLFRSLSAFAGGWTLEAASKVCCLPDPSGAEGCRILDEFEVLDLLTHLVDKSLVVVEESEQEARYRLLETVRQFARDESDAAAETADVRRRHLAYFLSLAEQAEPKLVGPEQAAWLHRLEREKDNLLAALEWSKRLDDGGETGLRLAGSIWRFWEIRGHLSTGLGALRELLDLALRTAPPDATPRASVGKALNAAGALAMTCGDHAEAQVLIEQALQLREGLGDIKGIGDSLNSLGLLALRQGEYVTARQRWEKSLAMRRQISDSLGIAASLNNLGLAATEMGDNASARAYFEEALSMHRKAGNRAWLAAGLNNLAGVMLNLGDEAQARKLFGEALQINREMGNRAWELTNLSGLGDACTCAGEYAKARELYEQALKIARQIDDKMDTAVELGHLARVALCENDPVSARPLLEQALDMYREVQSRSGIARCLELVGQAAIASGAVERGTRLLGAAAALRTAIGTPLPPSEKRDHDRCEQAARVALAAQLNRCDYDQLLAEGAALLSDGPAGWEPAADDAMAWLTSAAT